MELPALLAVPLTQLMLVGWLLRRYLIQQQWVLTV
jgi:hypothetical protein